MCGGTGYTVPDLPVSHPDFGRAMPCRCREQERLARRMRSMQRMGTLDALQRHTFETFITEPAHLSPEKAFNLRRAFETCRYFAEEPEGWLLLTGTYGCGKTHLAAAIANARIDLGQPVLFMVVPDLLDHLRSAFSPQSEVTYDDLFEQLRSTTLLVLDDLGAQSSTPWAQEKLFQLLNHRYNAQLATVITTNQRLEDLEPRLRSRLMDVHLVNHFAIIAPDFRAGKNPTQSDLSSLNLHGEQRFESFNARRSDLSGEERLNLQETFDACRAYAADPSGWFVLAGVSGCGKTHLAAAIAHERIERNQSDGMFIVIPDLLDHLRAAFSPSATTSYDRRFDEIKNTPLLVLDDLGTESATPWAKEKLFQLLNYRYSALLPTVITTSAEPKKMEPWLRTRLFDTSRCQFRAIIAPEYRGTRATPPRQAPRTARR
jgi:DNA replication protein DnaC